MSQKSSVAKGVKDIQHNTRRKYSAEDIIRILLEALQGEPTRV